MVTFHKKVRYEKIQMDGKKKTCWEGPMADSSEAHLCFYMSCNLRGIAAACMKPHLYSPRMQLFCDLWFHEKLHPNAVTRASCITAIVAYLFTVVTVTVHGAAAGAKNVQQGQNMIETQCNLLELY